MFLDLTKSLRLRSLEVNRNICGLRSTQIVAPHVHSLRFRNTHLSRTLVDAASLTEAKLDIFFLSTALHFDADFLQVTVFKMLEKLHNVEKLTFGGNFLQILSLAEVLGVPFPEFKVKALTFETVIFRYVIPGIERLLQNSPDLEKLTLRVKNCNTITEEHLDKFLNSQGLNTDQRWRSKDGVLWNKSHQNVEAKHVVSLVELVFKNTKILDKIVLLLNERYTGSISGELVATLSHNNKVSTSRSTDTSDGW
ncbi:unnamed protein product [Microthlaspi erraticum]|uniref:FBD domain-containing protein n=1 Tax=Microthlaspi erraticum TaxID=1685480 RepID=A0A6D2KAG5_9BRAS|nr:unnamed protein product [Microthlaspi erraticum]